MNQYTVTTETFTRGNPCGREDRDVLAVTVTWPDGAMKQFRFSANWRPHAFAVKPDNRFGAKPSDMVLTYAVADDPERRGICFSV